MKLLEIAKRGSGRMVSIQFTAAELLNIIAMFDSFMRHVDVGYTKEKKMLATMRKIFTKLEDCTREDVDFRFNRNKYGKVYYEHKEGEMDEVQRFINGGAGEIIQ